MTDLKEKDDALNTKVNTSEDVDFDSNAFVQDIEKGLQRHMKNRHIAMIRFLAVRY